MMNRNPPSFSILTNIQMNTSGFSLASTSIVSPASEHSTEINSFDSHFPPTYPPAVWQACNNPHSAYEVHSESNYGVNTPSEAVTVYGAPTNSSYTEVSTEADIFEDYPHLAYIHAPTGSQSSEGQSTEPYQHRTTPRQLYAKSPSASTSYTELPTEEDIFEDYPQPTYSRAPTGSQSSEGQSIEPIQHCTASRQLHAKSPSVSTSYTKRPTEVDTFEDYPQPTYRWTPAKVRRSEKQSIEPNRYYAAKMLCSKSATGGNISEAITISTDTTAVERLPPQSQFPSFFNTFKSRLSNVIASRKKMQQTRMRPFTKAETDWIVDYQKRMGKIGRKGKTEDWLQCAKDFKSIFGVERTSKALRHRYRNHIMNLKRRQTNHGNSNGTWEQNNNNDEIALEKPDKSSCRRCKRQPAISAEEQMEESLERYCKFGDMNTGFFQNADASPSYARYRKGVLDGRILEWALQKKRVEDAMEDKKARLSRQNIAR